MELIKVIKKIKTLAKKEKTPVYVVGGFVRDLFLGRKDFKDVDFVVDGSGIEFAQKLDKVLKEAGRLIVFEDFDTARYLFIEEVPNKNENEEPQEKVVLELEFAGARKEVYNKKSRKPKVSATTIEEDLARRDFTVNAGPKKL